MLKESDNLVYDLRLAGSAVTYRKEKHDLITKYESLVSKAPSNPSGSDNCVRAASKFLVAQNSSLLTQRISVAVWEPQT